MAVIERRRTVRPVEYPDSDGSLIAESDWHRDELVDLIHRLKARYADRPDVYVSGHMFVYYEEGDPRRVFAPDVMVVFGVPKGQRRVYKLWEERRAPSVVFEVSSRKTWREDRGRKRETCARLGIAEYFLWDPRYEYLTPPLQGFRLAAGAYEPMPPDPDGRVESTELGLRLCVESNRLELYDVRTNAQLSRPSDALEAARQVKEEARSLAEEAVRAAEIARRDLRAERAAREAAEERARRAETEAEDLRAELERLRRGRPTDPSPPARA